MAALVAIGSHYMFLSLVGVMRCWVLPGRDIHHHAHARHCEPDFEGADTENLSCKMSGAIKAKAESAVTADADIDLLDCLALTLHPSIVTGSRVGHDATPVALAMAAFKICQA